MANWFKKKIQQLSDTLNVDEAGIASNSNTQKLALQKETVAKPDNVEVLKEVAIGAITNAIKVLGHSDTVVAGLIFHSRFADNAIENIGLSQLVKSTDFLNQIQRTLKAKGVKYKDSLSIELIQNSPSADKVTQIGDGIGVEVITPAQYAYKIRAIIKATEGITWEPEYILEPSEKPYFIGRGRNPKIDNGPKLHNDIAFVGIEEKNEDQYKINNYVSRSHAYIVFDKEGGVFKIFRSKFLNNPSHKIKIYNTKLNDFAGINLSQSTVPHILRSGDSICFNDKVILECTIVNETGYNQ